MVKNLSTLMSASVRSCTPLHREKVNCWRQHGKSPTESPTIKDTKNTGESKEHLRRATADKFNSSALLDVCKLLLLRTAQKTSTFPEVPSKKVKLRRKELKIRKRVLDGSFPYVVLKLSVIFPIA